MGIKDEISTEYMKRNDVFADAFNMLVFDGKKVIKPDELQSLDPNLLTLPFKEDNSKVKSLKRYRDVLKKLIIKKNNDAVFLLLGIENQSEMHYAMPVRNMLYDAMQYCSQIQELSEANHKNSENLTSSEFLSGLKKTDKIMPVITLTVYFGFDKWDAPKSLNEMFTDTNDAYKPFIQDYKIFVIEPQMPDEDLNKLDTNLRDIMKFIKYSRNKEAWKQFLVDERFRNFNTLAAKLLKTMTNINIKLDETKENTDMCQAMQEIIEDVRKEYIEKSNKLIAEAKANETKLRAEAKANETKLRAKINEAQSKVTEAKANEEKAKAEIIVLKERIAQLEKAAKKQNQ